MIAPAVRRHRTNRCSLTAALLWARFARFYLDMARHGVLSVAVCWFSGGSGSGSRFITPVECPDAPSMSAASSPTAQRTVDALVQAVRTFPGVRADRVALFGHSRGGGAVLNYVLGGGSVQAAVINSAGYPDELAERAANLSVPILMLHGTSDNPSDGGSALTDVRMARAFEVALRRAARPVEAVYYDGGHNSILTNAAQRDDEVQRIAAFLERLKR
jgi:alpha-beta hydrolase superfamily lysophospholipase